MKEQMKNNENSERIKEAKETIFYQSFLNSWIDNRMTRDKQILILSSLSIGLLFTRYDSLNNYFELLVWIFSFINFIYSITTILKIYSLNSDYIEQILVKIKLGIQNNKIKEKLEKKLEERTKKSFSRFKSGLILLLFLLVINWFSKG